MKKKNKVLIFIQNFFVKLWSIIVDIAKAIGFVIKTIFDLLLKIPEQILIFLREVIKLSFFGIITISILIVAMSLSTYLFAKTFNLDESEAFSNHRERILNIIMIEQEKELQEWEAEAQERLEQ